MAGRIFIIIDVAELLTIRRCIPISFRKPMHRFRFFILAGPVYGQGLLAGARPVRSTSYRISHIVCPAGDFAYLDGERSWCFIRRRLSTHNLRRLDICRSILCSSRVLVLVMSGYPGLWISIIRLDTGVLTRIWTANCIKRSTIEVAALRYVREPSSLEVCLFLLLPLLFSCVM